MNENDVARFFDSLTSDYTATIERCFLGRRLPLALCSWATLLTAEATIRHNVGEIGDEIPHCCGCVDRKPSAEQRVNRHDDS